MEKYCKVCGNTIENCTCTKENQPHKPVHVETKPRPKFCKHCGNLLEQCTCNKEPEVKVADIQPENKSALTYCKVCGNPLDKCICSKDKQSASNVIPEETSNYKDNISDRPIFSIKDKANIFERNKKIVPDCIMPDGDEVPVRQYEIAYMRTILKGMRAEGRLQVTNKRVLFRGAGVSLLGPVELQHEFAINDIAGIELRRDYRIGFLTFILGVILAAFITSPVSVAFSNMAESVHAIAVILAILLSVIGVGTFVLLKRRLILKLILNSLALGACYGMSFDMLWGIIPKVTGGVFALIAAVVAIVHLLNLILVAFTPNLVIAIKTNSASAPIEIRRKQTGMFAVNKNEYTGFADVMPGKDFNKAKKELGTMIRDINTNGLDAVNKWKE